MTGKTVRFRDDNDVYSDPNPPTPDFSSPLSSSVSIVDDGSATKRSSGHVRFSNENETTATSSLNSVSLGPAHPNNDIASFATSNNEDDARVGLYARFPSTSPPASLVSSSPSFSFVETVNQTHSLPSLEQHREQQSSPPASPSILHPALSNPSPISLDFNIPPTDLVAQVYESLDWIDPSLRMAPALYTQTMKIKCHFLPWMSEIKPVDGLTHITIEETLAGVYGALYIEATKSELNNEDSISKAEIIARFKQRSQHRKDVFRRIDWLPLDERCFAGLEADDNPNTWVLCLQGRH